MQAPLPPFVPAHPGYVSIQDTHHSSPSPLSTQPWRLCASCPPAPPPRGRQDRHTAPRRAVRLVVVGCSLLLLPCWRWSRGWPCRGAHSRRCAAGSRAAPPCRPSRPAAAGQRQTSPMAGAASPPPQLRSLYRHRQAGRERELVSREVLLLLLIAIMTESDGSRGKPPREWTKGSLSIMMRSQLIRLLEPHLRGRAGSRARCRR